jgi:hypothetical protein
MGLLSKMAKKAKAPAKKKGARPVLEAEELHQNIEDFLEAKKQAKTAKASVARAEGKIIEAAEQARIDGCTRSGKYESSQKVSASTGTVTVKFPNRYSKIDPADEDSLKEVYGEETFERYFGEQTEVAMTAAAMEDEKFIETMMETLGEDKFERYFDISSHIAPKKNYHEARVLDKKLAEKHQEAVDQGLVSCTKPSLVAG